jgi:hypothetical protein
MLIKLATQIRQAVVISGLEENVPRKLDSIQDLYLKHLCKELPIRNMGQATFDQESI